MSINHLTWQKLYDGHKKKIITFVFSGRKKLLCKVHFKKKNNNNCVK